VNFLVDHQLPPALARFLETYGHSAKHVRELGFKEAEDAVIWRYAVANDMTVISKEQDFYFIATSVNAGRLVWSELAIAESRHFSKLSKCAYRKFWRLLKAIPES
jgi:predicted nuclease of predicted toxin-antitoxin system